MSKFRSLPVEIEAVQFSITGQILPDWFTAEVVAGRIYQQGEEHEDGPLTIVTANGPVSAVPGDWIIREPNGIGCYPCKPDVFARKYEPVTEIEHKGTIR